MDINEKIDGKAKKLLSKFIYKSDLEALRLVLRNQLASLEPSSNDDLNRLLRVAVFIITNGDKPASYFNKFQYIISGCDKVWGPNTVFYRCRKCQSRESNSLCGDCFKNGPHRDHDYVVEKSVYGGSCDCNNVRVWPKAGACYRHITKEHRITNAERSEMHSVERRIDYVLTEVLHFLVEKPRSLSFIQSILDWLLALSSSFQIFRRLLKRKIISQYKDDRLEYPTEITEPDVGTTRDQYNIIDVFLWCATNLHSKEYENMGNVVSMLILCCFSFDDFRVFFIDLYLQKYKDVLAAVISGNNGIQLMRAIGSQIFQYAEFSERISRGSDFENFMLNLRALLSISLHTNYCEEEILCSCSVEQEDPRERFLRALAVAKSIKSPRFHSFSNKTAHTIKMSEDVVFKSRLLTVIEDFNFIMSSHYFPSLSTTASIRVFAQYLDILFPFQTMHKMKLTNVERCLPEKEVWRVSWPVASVLTNSFKPEHVAPTKEKLLLMLKLCISSLAEWIQLRIVECEEVPTTVLGISTFKFNIFHNSVSFHIPLHRLFFKLIRYGLARQFLSLDELSQSFLPSKMSDVHVKFFLPGAIEFPLRVILLHLTVKSGWWQYSGQEPVFSSQLYLKNFSGEDSMDLDIFALKLGVRFLGYDRMVELILSKLGLADAFLYPCDVSSLPVSATALSDILVNLIKLFGLLGGETVTFDHLDRFNLREFNQIESLSLIDFLVHKVALGKRSFSEIVEGMPSYYSRDTQVIDTFLGHISFRDAKGSSKQRTYELNDTGRSILNPFFMKYSKKEEGEISACDFPRVAFINEQLQLQESNVKGPTTNFHSSKYLFLLIHWILFHFCYFEDEQPFPQSLLDSAVSLIASISASTSGDPHEYDSNYSETVNIHGIRAFNLHVTAQNIWDFSWYDFRLSNLEKSESWGLRNLLMKIRSNERLSGSLDPIESICNDLACIDQELLLAEEKEKEKQKEVAMNRRAKIMKKLSLQGQKATRMFSEIDENEDSEAETPVCVYCKETSGCVYNEPIGLISHVFLSATEQHSLNKQHEYFYGKNHRDLIIQNYRNLQKSYSTNTSYSSTNSLNIVLENDYSENTMEMKVEILLHLLKSSDSETNIPNIKKEITNMGATTITHCGHYMHISCFSRFYRSFLVSSYSGDQDLLDVANSEFFCPGCRRLSNLVLPFVRGIPFSLYEREPTTTTFQFNYASEKLFTNLVEKEKENLEKLRKPVMERDPSKLLTIMINFPEEGGTDRCSPPPISTFKRNFMKYRMLVTRLEELLPKDYLARFYFFDSDVFHFSQGLFSAIKYTLSKLAGLRGHIIPSVFSGRYSLFFCEIIKEIVQQIEVGNRYGWAKIKNDRPPKADNLSRSALSEIINNVAIYIIAIDNNTESRREMMIDILESIFATDLAKNSKARDSQKADHNIPKVVPTTKDRRFSLPSFLSEHPKRGNEHLSRSSDTIKTKSVGNKIDEYIAQVSDSVLETDVNSLLVQLVMMQMPISKTQFILTVRMLLPLSSVISMLYIVESVYTKPYDMPNTEENPQNVFENLFNEDDLIVNHATIQEFVLKASENLPSEHEPSLLSLFNFVIQMYVSIEKNIENIVSYIEMGDVIVSSLSDSGNPKTQSEDMQFVSETIELMVLVFLRRAYLIYDSIFGDSQQNETSDSESEPEENANVESFSTSNDSTFALLSEFKNICSVFGLSTEGDSWLFDYIGGHRIFGLTRGWMCRHILHRHDLLGRIHLFNNLISTDEKFRDDPRKHRINDLFTVVRGDRQLSSLHRSINLPSARLPIVPRLLQLPENFLEVYENTVNLICKECGRVPINGAICLVCGKLICVGSECCRFNNQGGAFQHSVKCGAGSLVSLIIRSPRVLIIRGNRSDFFSSPYTDEHGEEDRNSSLSRPVYLREARFDELNMLYSASKIDYDTRILSSASGSTQLL